MPEVRREGALQLRGVRRGDRRHPANRRNVPLRSGWEAALLTARAVTGDKCRRPFPREELKLRVLHWERINEGQPLIPINGAFCPECNEKHTDPQQATRNAGCLGSLLGL